MELLTHDLLPELFRNCLRIEQTGCGTIPLRFTPAQLELYAETEGWEIRSRCPAGIALDMQTNAEQISMEFDAPRGARSMAFFDLWINGILSRHAGQTDYTSDFRQVTFDLPPGENRISVYLPQSREVLFSSVTIDNGASVKPVPPPARTLFCLGDSITQGMSALYPSSTYAVQLAHLLNAELLNQGVGGYIFEPASLDPELDFVPDIITVAYGTNDWGRFDSLAQFRDNCHAYLHQLRRQFAAADIAVLSPIWRADLHEDKAMGPFGLLKETIDEVCNDLDKTAVIDGLELIPHIPEYCADQSVHPNDLGFMHYATNLYQALRAKEIV